MHAQEIQTGIAFAHDASRFPETCLGSIAQEVGVSTALEGRYKSLDLLSTIPTAMRTTTSGFKYGYRRQA